MNIFIPRQQEIALVNQFGEEGLQHILAKLLKAIAENGELQEALIHVERFARYNHADQRTVEESVKLLRRMDKKLEASKDLVAQRERQISNQKQQIIDLKTQLASVEHELGRVRRQLEVAQEDLQAAQDAIQTRELNPPALPPAAAPSVLQEAVERVVEVEKIVHVEVPVEVRVPEPIDPKVFADAVDWAAHERLRLAMDEGNLMDAVRKVAAQELLLKSNRSEFIEFLFGAPKRVQEAIANRVIGEAFKGVEVAGVDV